MRLLSAIDAIGPAWNHTTRLLVAPRNWRLALKICIVACFAQVGGCNSSFRSPGHYGHSLPPAMIAALVGVAMLIGVAILLIWLIFFYLGSRLQFVLFEIVLRSDTEVTPIWRRYGQATWRWMGLKVIYVIAAVVCLSPIVIPMVIHFARTVGPTFSHRPPHDFLPFITAMIAFGSALFFVLLAIGVGYTLLHDFGIPSMALESTPMSETVRRVWSLLRAEPAQVLVYLLMRFLLGLAGSIIGFFGVAVGVAVALIPFGGAGVLDWFLFRHSGITGHAVMITAWVVLGMILLALILVAAFLASGVVLVFQQAYALYFLGGRYPLVGRYLEPFLPPVYAYAPVMPAYPTHQPPAAPPPLPIEGEP